MLDTLFSGLIHGGVYALVAVGMSLVFGVTNVANFAQGSLVAVGMMVAWWLGTSLGWGIVPTVVAVVVVTGILGLLLNVAVISPLEGRKPIAALLATIGVGQVLDNGLQMIFGPQTRPFPNCWTPSTCRRSASGSAHRTWSWPSSRSSRCSDCGRSSDTAKRARPSARRRRIRRRRGRWASPSDRYAPYRS